MTAIVSLLNGHILWFGPIVSPADLPDRPSHSIGDGMIGVALRYPDRWRFLENALALSGSAWILERSATRLREADLNVLSKLGNQGLEWRLEPKAFTGREVCREDDLLDFLVGGAVDIHVARQPST